MIKETSKQKEEFEKFWAEYGELCASFCGGDIKEFAKNIWLSARSEERRRDENEQSVAESEQ